MRKRQLDVLILHICTMHVDSIKSVICPTNSHNYYKIVKLLKSFKIIIVAPACFGLHKPSSGSYNLCFAKVTMLTSVTYRYLKVQVLWLHAASIPLPSVK